MVVGHVLLWLLACFKEEGEREEEEEREREREREKIVLKKEYLNKVEKK